MTRLEGDILSKIQFKASDLHKAEAAASVAVIYIKEAFEQGYIIGSEYFDEKAKKDLKREWLKKKGIE